MDEGFNIRDFIEQGEMEEDEINRCEFWVMANRVIRETGKPNHEEAQILVNTNWNLEQLETWLEEYPDKQLMEYLRFGWPLNSKNIKEDISIPRNQKGARENTEQIRKYLKDELKNGSIIGPFNRNPFGKDARFSLLDTRPKKDSDDLRVIPNLSHPYKRDSVNNSIDKNRFGNEDMDLRYPTVDDLCRIVRKKGRNCRIFHRDLTKAYRLLWMSPADIMLLGYVFENCFYFDISLTMGSSSAAYCCQRMTNAITFIYRKHFNYDNVNYLDDFGVAETAEKAEEAFTCLGNILQKVGIREAEKKACAPVAICIFLGILYNTNTMMLQITSERLSEIKIYP